MYEKCKPNMLKMRPLRMRGLCKELLFYTFIISFGPHRRWTIVGGGGFWLSLWYVGKIGPKALKWAHFFFQNHTCKKYVYLYHNYKGETTLVTIKYQVINKLLRNYNHYGFTLVKITRLNNFHSFLTGNKYKWNKKIFI